MSIPRARFSATSSSEYACSQDSTPVSPPNRGLNLKIVRLSKVPRDLVKQTDSLSDTCLPAWVSQYLEASCEAFIELHLDLYFDSVWPSLSL